MPPHRRQGRVEGNELRRSGLGTGLPGVRGKVTAQPAAPVQPIAVPTWAVSHAQTDTGLTCDPCRHSPTSQTPPLPHRP